MNVVSLSGTSGLGDNAVTAGLGPTGKPVPPTPPPKRRVRTGGTDEAERVWRDRWQRIHEEQAIARRPRREILEDVEWLDESTLDEADYLIVAMGNEALVRAPATGRMRYVRTKKYGLCAVILADTGARYLITGLGSTEDRRVTAGDVIGKTTRSPMQAIIDMATAATAATWFGAPKTAPKEAAQLPAATPTVFDLTVNADGDIINATDTHAPAQQTTGALTPAQQRTVLLWPTQAETLVIGLPIASVVLAAGSPVLGIVIGIATLVIATKRPKTPE